MKKKILLVLAAAAFMATGCGVGRLKEDGNAFMEAMKAGDAEKSYAMLDASLQKELNELEGWKKWSEIRKPSKWSFSGFNINANGTGRLEGDAEFPSGTKADLELNFLKVGEVYKVVGINFKEKK